MKIKHNGIEVSLGKDEAMVKKYHGGFVLACVLTVSAIALSFTAKANTFTKDDLGEPINAFLLYPVVMDEPYKTERASYAYQISGGDRDFVKMLQAENGAWTHDSKHPLPYALCWTWDSFNRGVLPNQKACWNNPDRFTKTHYDYGFCGMSDGYKKHIVDDPRFLSDWKWQIEQCYNEYKAGTRFYGFDKRYERWNGEFVAYDN